MEIRSEAETEKDPTDTGDLLAEVLTEIPTGADPNFFDAIMQFDGPGDDSSDEYDYDFFPSVQLDKRPRLNDGAGKESSDEESDCDLFPSAQLDKRPRLNSNEHDPNIDEDSEEEEEREQIGRSNSDAQGSNSRTESQIPNIPDSRFVMKDGRKHVVTPHTGSVYVFFKGNKTHPASIRGHVNDLLTMAKVEKTLEKPNLLLLLDDGLDWGGNWMF